MKIYDAQGDVVFDNGPATLRGLVFERFEMRGWQMQHLDLSECNFLHCQILECNFAGSDLTGAGFHFNSIKDTVFDEACLNESNWNNGNLKTVSFNKATLVDAVWGRVYANSVSFKGADLTNLDTEYSLYYQVDFREAKMVGFSYKISPDHALFSPGTTLDRGTIRSCWHDWYMQWPVTIHRYADHTVMQIGCREYTADEWASFTLAQIADMAAGALDFWLRHRSQLLAKCENIQED